jgi:putative tryptophan/tyrosine transport system substrate-binding protein
VKTPSSWVWLRALRDRAATRRESIFLSKIVAKRLGLRELVPQAVRVAVLVNPGNRSVAEATLQALPETAGASGVQTNVLKASTSEGIEAAFATIVRERADAVFIAPDGFFISRRMQLALLAMRHGLPMAQFSREGAEAGGLMSYGADTNE